MFDEGLLFWDDSHLFAYAIICSVKHTKKFLYIYI